MRIRSGTRVIITGGGRGIGRLLAEVCAARGAHVLIADIDAALAEACAAELRARGGRVSGHAVDVADPASVAEFAQVARRELSRVELLINNAGVVRGGAFERVPLAEHLHTYRVNIEGLVAMTHTFFEDLSSVAESHVVNIASASGYIGLPFGSTYASSKWAVIGFSESLRLELRERGLRSMHVTTVCPSYIATGMFEGVKAPLLMPFLQPASIVRKIVQGIEADAVFVKEPFGVKSLELMRAVIPRRLFDANARRLGVYDGMAHWQGHGAG